MIFIFVRLNSYTTIQTYRYIYTRISLNDLYFCSFELHTRQYKHTDTYAQESVFMIFIYVRLNFIHKNTNIQIHIHKDQSSRFSLTDSVVKSRIDLHISLLVCPSFCCVLLPMSIIFIYFYFFFQRDAKT